MSAGISQPQVQDNITKPISEDTNPSTKSSPRSFCLPLGMQYAAIMVGCLLFANIQLGFKGSDAAVMASDKAFLLIYLAIECSSLFFENFPQASFIGFSILVNMATVAVVGTYSSSTVLISLCILPVFLTLLGVIAYKMPIDVTGFSDYFIIFCLFFCTLQVLNSWMFWNMAIPRLVGLAVGSLLFSASIVINVQVLMARGSNQVKEPGLIVLKLATSSSYLLLSELASLTT